MKKQIARLPLLCWLVFTLGTTSATAAAKVDGHWVSAWGTAVLAPFPFPGAAVPSRQSPMRFGEHSSHSTASR